MKKNALHLSVTLLLLSLCLLPARAADGHWTGTWASAMEYTGPSDMPQTSLSNRSVRQIVHLSLGGDRMRVQLSNEFGSGPVDIKAVYIAEAGQREAIVGKARYLSFNGKRAVTIQPHETVYSDVLSYALRPLQRLSVTICYGDRTPEHATSHRGSRTNSYIMAGAPSPKADYRPEETVPHWYNLAKIEVLTKAECIAVLGNSITDGRGSTTDRQDRWTDRLAEALGGNVGVLNLGIGGNAVVEGGLSQPALQRFDRDILGQQGVTRLIIFEGTNDIGCCNANYEQMVKRLIDAYQTMIRKGKDAGMKVYLGTITPTQGNSYFSWWHEAMRQAVNTWIRSQAAHVDGIIDFDELMRDPQQPQRIRPEWQTDGLHPNAAGYEAMGQYAAKVIVNSGGN